jgi:single-stranded-DNA-specific exonuclease
LGLDRVDEFAEAFDQAMGKVQSETGATALWVEGACTLGDLDVKSLQELERLGPFGPGNPEPVFTVRAWAQSHRVLKGRHLKLNLGSGVEGIWFHGAERQDVMEGLDEGGEREWAGVPELNRFRGQLTPTLRVRDWRKVGTVE